MARPDTVHSQADGAAHKAPDNGRIYGNTDTLAFKAAASALEERIDTSARTKEGGR